MDNFTVSDKLSVLRSSLLIKLFTILILSLFAPKVFAQLDLIHYVPPFYAGTKYDADIGNHWVVLTTPSEEPITVTIRRGDGSLVATKANVSITTPQRYYFKNEDYGNTYGTIARPNLSIVNYTGLNKVLTRQGLIFTSENAAGKGVAFYVNIRHKSNIHGLSLTAKGQAALGTSFRSGHLHSVRGSVTQSGWSPSSSYIVDHRSHFISVMATEDNTEVTFSDIKVGNLTSDTKTALSVADITTDVATATSVSDFTDDGVFNVILNAGESYVLGANHEFLTPTDVNKFNGTKISSDKPIAVNSGSWCGSASTSNKQDIGVDQIVPEKLVGNEYILLRGQGNSGSERPIVVATQDGTNITVNGSGVIINPTPLNAGESYAIETAYFDVGEGTMLVNTNHSVYMYQTTAASADKPYPTVGMNFIPPLSSLGFRQVDIPFINELGTGIVAIYSQKGADVFVNGVELDETTAKTFTTKEEWVVYKYSTTDENVSVKSNKAIYVAMSVFDNVVGAAGYFSGFTKSISPIDTTIVFNHDLGYVCSSQEGNIVLAINSTPVPDWYEWYHDVVHLDSIKFKNENLVIPIPEEATKYILKAYFRDPNMDILYNGDFAIGRGSFDSDLDFFDVLQLTDPGKATLTANPKSVNSSFENFTDLDGVGKMLLSHSLGNGASNVIWKQTINSSTDIPGNLFVLKVYGRLAEASVDQYLDVYVNNEKVYNKFQLNDTKAWQSIKAFWRAGTAESAEIKIVDANAAGNQAVFALDSISFVPAIEAQKDYNPDVVPSYSYTPFDQGLHICKGAAEAYADISYGDMGWFTFLWEKQNEDLTFSSITDLTIEGLDTYKLIFKNVVNDHAGIYRCTINFRGDYEECGIGAEPTSVLVEVFVDEPASIAPLVGKTELCEGTPTDIIASISGDFSVIKWSVSNSAGLLKTIENNSGVFEFNSNLDYAAGEYTVRCEVVNGCSTDLYEEIGIEILGKAKLEDLIIPTNLCAIKEITLDAELVDNYIPAGSTLEYSWFRNSSIPMGVTSVGYISNITPDINDLSYKVKLNTHYNFGETNQFTCEGNSIEENLVSNPIDPEIKIVGLSPVSICEGLPQTYLVELETTSDSYTYSWDVPDAAKVGKIPADYTSNSFVLDPVSLGMAGGYTVTVSNNCDPKSSTSTLTVNPKLLVTGVTALPIGPYCSDLDVTFTINDNGHASSYIAKNLRTNETRNSVTNTFTIKANASTEGEWLVTALNSCGNKETSFTIDLVGSFILKPIVSIEACVGGNVSLKAIVESPPAGLTYQWKDQLGVDIADENSSVLEFNPVELTDAGEYTCVVSDGVCSTQQEKGTLSVDDVTTVNLTPGSVDICEGLTHHFEVSYVGNPIFAWFFTGADDVKKNLNISTSFYDTPLLDMADAGLYSCEITTGCGLKEFKQSLNVLTNVVVAKDPSVVLDICEGEHTTLILNVTGNYASIKWYKNDVLFEDGINRTISTGELVTDGTFEYKYIVEGSCGPVEGTFAVVVHDKPSIDAIADINACVGNIPLSMSITGTDYKNPLWLNPDGSLLGNGENYTLIGATYPGDNYTAKISSDYCGDVTTTAKVNVYKPIAVLSNSELNPTPCVGDPLSLSVTGEGDCTYKWTKGGLDLGIQAIPNILNLESADLSDNGTYKCELISVNTCIGAAVDFEVNVREDAKITLQPLAKTPCEGVASVTFTVAGTAEGDLSYKWFKNDVEISNSVDYSGATTADLTVSNLSDHDTHLFHCVISGDFCEDVASNQVSLNVIEDITLTPPTDQTIDENESATFSVVAAGGGTITYQWFEKTTAGGAVFVSMGSSPASAQTASLTLASVPFSKDGYEYRCEVTNGNACDTKNGDATLNVNVDNRITSTILNAEACVGGSFTFTVDYKNTTDACIWEYDDGTGYSDASGIGTIASGGTSSTLTVTTATTAMETDSWKFRARVLRTGYEPNVSNEATVKVYEQIVFDPIADATLCPTIGGSFNVNITAGTSPYTYEWTRVGSGEVLGLLSNLSLSDSESVSEEYNVKVSNLVCSDVEQKFDITRHPNLVLTDLAHPSPLCIGSDIDLDAILTEGPAIAATYIWTKDGIDLSEPNGAYSKSGITTAESGIYKVVVSDNCISKTSSIPIIVLDAITLTAVSLTPLSVCEGESFDLQVNGTGENLVYNWYKIGAPGGGIVGVSLSSDKDYHINGLSTIGANYYRCVLSSTPNCTNPVQEFTVNVGEDIEVDPLAPITICEDLLKSTFTVSATGEGPYTYQWYNNSGLMSGEESASLLIDNTVANNGQNYYCIVSGACKSAESNTALFTVNENVTITTQPVNVSVSDVATDPINFSVEATGTGLTYQWWKNGSSMGAVNASAQTKTLTILSTDFNSGDSYHCVISSDVSCNGETSSTATLTISITDKITSNPTNTEICEGSLFDFTVKFKNTVTSCVWEYSDDNGSTFKAIDALLDMSAMTFNLLDTENTLTINPSTFSMDEWQFRATIDGIEPSSIAKVKVYEKIVFDDISTEILCLGTGKGFNVNITKGTGPFIYEWRKDGTLIPGETDVSLNLTPVTAIDGTYNVLVKNDVCPDVDDSFDISHHPGLVFPDLTYTSPLCIGDGINLSAIASFSASGLNYKWTRGATNLGTNSTLDVTPGISGIYKVVVADDCTSKSSSIPITVLDAINLIAASPANQDVCEGEPFDLQVEGTGDNLVYNWYKIVALGGAIDGASLSTDKDYHIDGLTSIGENYYRCILSSTPDCTRPELDFTVNVQENVTASVLAPIEICQDVLPASEFSVTATGEGPFTYQWYDNDVSMGITETNASLSVNNVLINNGHNYHVVVGGTCKSDESNKALFTVNENVTITSDPVDQTIDEMGSATFTVDATGTGLTYQWFVDKGGVVSSILGATTNTLSLTSVPLDKSGNTYYCEVSGTCVDAPSNPATLTVVKENRILVQAEPAVVCEGNTFTLRVDYKDTTGDCEWEYDDNNDGNYTPIAGEDNYPTYSELTLTATYDMNDWEFRAVVKRTDYVNNLSNDVKVKVYKQVSFTPIDDVEICKTSAINFSVDNLLGTGPVTYLWKELNTGTTIATSSSFSFSVGTADAGDYEVHVTNGVCLVVTDPFTISHYDDLSLNNLIHDNELCPTDDINLSVTINPVTLPAPGITYSWTKNDGDLGIAAASYNKTGVTDLDAGLYKVTVKDLCMIQSKSIQIDVLDIITKVPSDWTNKLLCVGDALLLEAKVIGDNPSYTWSLPVASTRVIGDVSDLNIDAILATDAGTYTCDIIGSCGTASYTVDISINDIPNITTDLDLSAVCVGEPLKLGPIAYDLTTNTTIDESIKWILPDGSTSSVTGLELDLLTAEIAEEGNYRVEVSNVCGTDFSVGYLDVHLLPTLAPIADQIACQGENVIFKAEATGENLIYRWLIDDEAVAAALDGKPELIISNIQPFDENTPITYAIECIVSSCGKSEKETATVTVNPNTILKKSIKGDVVYVGSDYTFDLDVTGSNLNFEWHHVNTFGVDSKLDAVTTMTLTISDLNLPDAGEYYCIITGDCGVRFTSGYLAVKDPIKLITGLGTANIEKCFGDPLNLNISVEGEIFSIDWYKVIGETKTPLGYDGLHYSIPSLDISDSGTYRCEIRGEGGSIIEEVNVIVYETTVLKSHLTDRTLCELEDLQWIPDVSGSVLIYDWKYNGVSITDLDPKKASIEIDNLKMEQAGVYSVDISGKCGNVSSEANLSLNKLPFFISKSDDVVVCENYDEIVFSVVYGGDNLEYQWQKDDADIDGAMSSELKLQNIRVSDAGEYKCVVSSSCGLVKYSIMKLEVIPQLKILSESPGMEICDGEDAQFMIVVDGNNVVYQWKKDGVDLLGEIATELTINAASSDENGYYSCAVTDKCTSTERYSNSKKLKVNSLPSSDILGRMTLCVLEDRVAYNTADIRNLNYGWLVDGGEFTTPAEGIRTKVTWGDVVEGSNLKLIITNEATGCSSKVEAPVTLRPLPEVNLAALETRGICENEFDLSGGFPTGGIYWVDGVAQNTFDPNQGNGEYQVRYSYTDDLGCSNSTGELVMKVDSLPIVKIVEDVVVGTCETEQLSATTEENNIRWSPGLYLDDRDSENPIFTAGETTLYVATVVDKHGCVGNDIINVTVAPLPLITTINDTIIGECKEIQLTTIISGDIDEITWTNASDLDDSNNSNPKLINRQVGVNDYQINVTDKYGCVASGSVKVEVLPNPEVGENQNLCEGETLLVNTKDLSNPLWSDGYTAWERTIDKPGEYELSVTQNDCELIQKIVMNPLPIFELDNTVQPGIVIFEGQTVTLEPDLNPDYGPFVYDWSDGSILPKLEVSESGVYKLKVEDKLGCVATDTVVVDVRPIGIESPNAFTPLSENENNRFYLKDINVTDKFEMYVYNRWGELLYKTNEAGYATGWNGTYRGEACPIGTYVWVLMLDGKVKEKGTVTLLR